MTSACSPSPALVIQRPALGQVNKLLLQSFVDGPGNRAVVFLQGCNLRCAFCHNPQTMARCSQCGACVSECPSGALRLEDGIVHWDEVVCQDCDTCIQVCPSYSSPKVREASPEMLWGEIEPQALFLNGVTVTGGEPTLQIQFLEQFLHFVKTRSDLTTLVETNGMATTDCFARLLPDLDLTMIDLKVFDTQAHRKLTGQGNERVKETIRYLAGHGKVYAVRLTVVPGRSDSLQNAADTARFIAGVDPHIRLCFLRFRAHGTRGEALGWPSPSDEQLDQLVDAAKREGVFDVSRSI
jgi:YjjW family glycine radical enzyme activase